MRKKQDNTNLPIRFYNSNKNVNFIFKTTKSYMWQNMWKNLHFYYKSLIIYRFLQKRFLHRGISINKFYLRHGYNNLNLKLAAFGNYKEYKVKKLTKQYFKKMFFPSYSKPFLKGKKIVQTLVKSINPAKIEKAKKNVALYLIKYFKVSYLKFQFYRGFIGLINLDSLRLFKKYKNEPYFLESLQVSYAVFKGIASASLLGNFILNYTRRNPKRLFFVSYIKRLLSWHYNVTPVLKIYGLRLEIKGRFNAKSRSKKYIISCGRIIKYAKISKVDYAFSLSITKFGSLGIKGWICPKVFKLKTKF